MKKIVKKNKRRRGKNLFLHITIFFSFFLSLFQFNYLPILYLLTQVSSGCSSRSTVNCGKYKFLVKINEPQCKFTSSTGCETVKEEGSSRIYESVVCKSNEISKKEKRKEKLRVRREIYIYI